MKLLDDKLVVEEFDPFEAIDAAEDAKKIIILTDEMKENMKSEDGPKYVYGKVQLVGEGKRLDNGTVRPMMVSANDVVCYYGAAGFKIRNSDGEWVRVISEPDVIAIL